MRSIPSLMLLLHLTLSVTRSLRIQSPLTSSSARTRSLRTVVNNSCRREAQREHFLAHPYDSNSMTERRPRRLFMSSSDSSGAVGVMDDLFASSRDLNGKEKTKYLFVGGKGGVGKTSTSSAIAIRLSDAGFRTLVVSTDPAHSLGDALDVTLPIGRVTPIVTEPSLWALEIDCEEALTEFKDALQGLDAEGLSASLGVPRAIVDSLGLDDLAGLFANPPPGIDEIVALTKIFQLGDSVEGDLPSPIRYDRVIIDTAPTGHTIRLLQLPAILGTFTGKILGFKRKLSGALDSFKSFFGGGAAAEGSLEKKLDSTFEKIETFQRRITQVQSLLRDSSSTQFAVVSIPTSLAVAETKRLVQGLGKEGIKVSGILCNQVIADGSGEKYVATRSAAQQFCISNLRSAASNLSRERQTFNPEITEVSYIDTEVTGLYGLRYFASIAHPPLAKTATNPIDSRKLTIFGGKGGVGKTTSAASWAVQLADAGLRTLVVSTDPAHSLGDALSEKLSGDPRMLEITASGGQLWAMEVDPETALEEFREIMRENLSTEEIAGSSSSGGGGGGLGGLMEGMGLPNLKAELGEMLSSVSDPPPGTDEVIALTKIMTYLEEGLTLPSGQKVRFDRIVLDTAPTGHTLRMLSLPTFLQGLTARVRAIRDKTGAGSISDANGKMNQDRILEFEGRMSRLEDMLRSPKETEFTAVTIPTELAVAETKRLLASLQEESIFLRRIIVNQILPKPSTTTAATTTSQSPSPSSLYLDKLRNGQRASLAELRSLSLASGAPLVEIPYFDTEVRSVYGLRIVGYAIFGQQQQQ